MSKRWRLSLAYRMDGWRWLCRIGRHLWVAEVEHSWPSPVSCFRCGKAYV